MTQWNDGRSTDLVRSRTRRSHSDVCGVAPGALGLRPIARTLWLVAAMACSVTSARAGDPAPFHALLEPPLIDDVVVAEQFDISFAVDSTARQFNAYEVTVEWDQDIIEFLGVTEGELMTGACGVTFDILAETDSSFTYSHVLLCAGISVDGPGVLSIFRFRALALGSTPVEITSHPDQTFVDAGVWVSPAHPTFPRQVSFQHSLVIVVDPTSDAPAPVTSPVGLQLEVWPQPVSESAEFRIVSPKDGWLQTDLLDVTGRRLWSQRSWANRDEPLSLRWSRTDADGGELSAGVYFVRTQLDEMSAMMRVIAVR